jgi:hypothetical protein
VISARSLQRKLRRERCDEQMLSCFMHLCFCFTTCRLLHWIRHGKKTSV